MANSRAQLRNILIRISGGNWAKNSSMRPGGNGVVIVVVGVMVVGVLFICARSVCTRSVCGGMLLNTIETDRAVEW